MIGYCFCGSFCTVSRSLGIMRNLAAEGNAENTEIVEENALTEEATEENDENSSDSTEENSEEN